MSCPCFEPIEPRPCAAASRRAMLPLGDAWTGICHAVPDQLLRPDDSQLDTFCNFGYARGHCPRFPADCGPDAVRFTIVSDDGAALRLYYVLERDHRPFAHGPLEFSVARGELTTPAEGELTGRQAGAYAASYLRRRSEFQRR
ncbi:MAG TPA: hypothetical protein VIN93_04695 [Bryobacteraceae bacterium]